MDNLHNVTPEHFLNTLKICQEYLAEEFSGPTIQTIWCLKNSPILLKIDKPHGTTAYFAVSKSRDLKAKNNEPRSDFPDN